MSKFTKSISTIDRDRVCQCLEAIEQSSFEEIDSNIKWMWKEVVAWYALKVITDSQRDKLTKYRERRAEKNKVEREKYIMERLRLVESYDEPTETFQFWMLSDRIIVASVRTEMEWKTEKQVANWWHIVEIYKSETPKAYDYAKRYPIHLRVAS